jgi:hypothetical protein
MQELVNARRPWRPEKSTVIMPAELTGSILFARFVVV